MNWMNPYLAELARWLPTWDPAQPWLPQILHFTLLGGTFVCTVLVMRMLVTRWGDDNVTAKAILVSAMLHAVAAMWTTKLMLVPASSFGPSEQPIPLREVIVSEVPEIAKRDTPARLNQAASDRPWEKLPDVDSTPSRHVKRDHSRGPTADTVEIERSHLQDPALSAVSLTDRVDSPLETHETVPQISGENETRWIAGSAPQIDAGPTAESRAEVQLKPTAGRTKLSATQGPNEFIPESRSPKVAEQTNAGSLAPQPTTSTALDNAPMATSTPSPATTVTEGDEVPRTARLTRLDGISKPVSGTTVSEPDGEAAEAPSGRFQRTSRRRKLGGSEGNDDPLTLEPSTPAAGRPGEAASALTGRSLVSRGTTGAVMGRDQGPDVLTDGEPTGTRAVTKTPARYRLRGQLQRRALQYGATEDSERAVEAALVWMARHQSPAGNWDPDGFAANCPAGDRCSGLAVLGRDPEMIPLSGREKEQRERSGVDADTGITGLVLLSYLGAGYTHAEGPYADTVWRGLQWLIKGQRADGYLGGKASYYAGAYCHGICTIALAESYALTREERLRRPLEKAVNYIVSTQNTSDGGWRYEKSQVGDMSVFGWQVMALKSAQTAGISVPPESLAGAARFLKSAALGTQGGLAGYGSHSTDRRVKASMTAEALFCRQLMGTPRTSDSAAEAVAYLIERPPTVKNYDLYYWYYATLAMYQHGGEPWRLWNESLHATLLSLQKHDGHSAGSWDPYPPWGDYGGRLFSTAMSTLCLEVYYRFAPAAE